MSVREYVYFCEFESRRREREREERERERERECKIINNIFFGDKYFVLFTAHLPDAASLISNLILLFDLSQFISISPSFMLTHELSLLLFLFLS